MADELRIPRKPSGRRLVLALNNPKARTTSGERHPYIIRLAVPVENLTDAKLAIVDQIQTLMVELMVPGTVRTVRLIAHNRVESRVATLERELVALRRAGTVLSNVAYNLAQRDHLKPDERESLNATRREWDAALVQNPPEASDG